MHADARIICTQTAPTPAELSGWIVGGAPMHFMGCSLSAADFGDAELTGWQFEKCDLRSARFDHAIVEETTFHGCRLTDATFRSARFDQTAFETCDASNANFAHSTLANVQFKGCKLIGLDFSGATSTDMVLKDSNIGLAQLRGLSFRRAHLEGVNFDQADLTDCDFRDAVFTDCSLRDAIVTDARFQGADLRDADLGGLRMSDAAQFKGATISKRQAGDLLAQLGLNVL